MANLSAQVPPGGRWSRDADGVMRLQATGTRHGRLRERMRQSRMETSLSPGGRQPADGLAEWKCRTGLMCKSSVILRQQHGGHRTVGLGNDPEAVGTLPVGGKQPASVVEGS